LDFALAVGAALKGHGLKPCPFKSKSSRDLKCDDPGLLPLQSGRRAPPSGILKIRQAEDERVCPNGCVQGGFLPGGFVQADPAFRHGGTEITLPSENIWSGTMAQVCDICGKGPQFGNNISHAHNVTRRRWNPNLQAVRALVNGSAKRIRVCTSCIKSGKIAKA
jgi:large subunit ribosomal protein L28